MIAPDRRIGVTGPDSVASTTSMGVSTLSVRVRQIRVAGVPADFRVPRGWPTPTDRWIRENAFWQPPHGWTPGPQSPAAPADWQFWTPNRLWWTTRAQAFQPAEVWRRLASLLSFVGIAFFIAGRFFDPSLGFGWLWFAAIVASLVLIVIHDRHRTRISNALLEDHARVAAHGRHERLTRDYQRYLTAVA